MRSDLDVKITAGLAIFMFAALAVFKGSDFSRDVVSVVSTAVTWTVILRLLFVKWMWKWKILRFLEQVHKVPCLEGKWIGEYHSTGNPNTPPDRLKGVAEVEICQPDIHTIKVVRKSEESTSRSFGEEINVSNDGLTHLTYTYLSEPKATVRDRSPISYGAARLSFTKGERQKLEGNYWTDQKTTGFLSFERQR